MNDMLTSNEIIFFCNIQLKEIEQIIVDIRPLKIMIRPVDIFK